MPKYGKVDYIFKVWKNVYKLIDKQGHICACDVEFIVNREKQKVTALLRGVDSKKVYSKGVAKCIPDDVFNEHIGKAIALGRALGLDVSEFENTVNPTFSVGQKIKIRDTKNKQNVIYTIKYLGEKHKDLYYESEYGKRVANSGGLDDFYLIVDDSDTHY